MEQRVIMKRIDQILSHPVFREQFALLQEAEKDRIFCRHTMEHFLDVARLAYIRALEENAPGQDWRNASLRTVIFLLLSRNRFLLRSEATG